MESTDLTNDVSDFADEEPAYEDTRSLNEAASLSRQSLASSDATVFAAELGGLAGLRGNSPDFDTPVKEGGCADQTLQRALSC